MGAVRGAAIPIRMPAQPVSFQPWTPAAPLSPDISPLACPIPPHELHTKEKLDPQRHTGYRTWQRRTNRTHL
ncbi:hypothetical protein LZ32DRAFT_600232 [Colletotrichum eremochloae]|nr:hypothetical protein LZ32DRAFT_600232 [Colletotrichum eremochloae]